jgi:hypothetical protein
MRKRSMELCTAATSLALVASLGATGCSSGKTAEVCTITAPTVDDFDLVMQGYVRSINRCYDRTAAVNRKIFHGSSTTARITIPTLNGSRVEVNAQSNDHLSNGKPDPAQVSEIGAAVYRKGEWMPQIVLTAQRNDTATGPTMRWNLNAQEHQQDWPSVAIVDNQLLVNGQPNTGSGPDTLMTARGSIASQLRDVMDTAQGDPLPNLGPVSY